MKYPVLAGIFLAVVLLPSLAIASPLDDRVSALKTAIRQEMANKAKPLPNTPEYQAYAQAGYLAAGLDQLVAQMDNSNSGDNAEMQLTQVLAVYTSDAVQKAGHELIDEIRQERKARSAAATEEVQALLKHVSDVVAQAKKAKDLDEILAELQKYTANRQGGYDAENQALFQQVAQAFEFTKLWQNYLFHVENNQTQLASNDLQNLSQNNYGIGIIPRSQILERMTPTTTSVPVEGGDDNENAKTVEAEKIIGDIKTLDDMEPALAKLDPLRPNNQAVQMSFNALAPFVQLYINVKAGLPTTMNNIDFGSGEGLRLAPGLQAQLLLFVLQHYFDSYQGTPPAADELPPAFVRRVMDDAIARKDWTLLRQALAVQTYLSRNVNLGLYTNNNASAGMDDLLAALNQETAGQYALAVVSYQNALKIPDTTIPAKLIGEKLDAIQKDHPKEFNLGMQMVTEPPPAQMFNGVWTHPGIPAYPGPPGMTYGMPYRPGTSGGYENQSPVISIPGTAKPPVSTQPASPVPEVKKPAPKGNDDSASPKSPDTTSNSGQINSSTKNTGAPAPCTGIMAVAGSGAGEIDLSWINHPENMTYILVQQSTDNVNWTTVATLTDPTINSYVVKGLAQQQNYFFGVISANDL